MSLAVIGLAHKLKYVAEKENVQQDDLCQPGHDPYEKTASHAGFTPSWCYTCQQVQSTRQEYKLKHCSCLRIYFVSSLDS